MENITAGKVSNEKLMANRQNALKSTGPRTAEGKMVSRWNALKHGLLSKEIEIRSGGGRGDEEEYKHLLQNLQQDLQPAGMLEEILVEKIAISYWRLARVLRSENAEIRRTFAFMGQPSGSLRLLGGGLAGEQPAKVRRQGT